MKITTDRLALLLSKALVLGVAALITLFVVGMRHAIPHGAGGWSMTAAMAGLMALASAVIVERDNSRTASLVDSRPDRSDLSDRLESRTAAAQKATPRRRVLILGSGEIGQTLAESLEASGKYEVVGFVDDDARMDANARWSILGGRELTADIVAEHRVDEVVLAHAPSWKERLAHEMIIRHPDVAMRVVPSSYEALLKVNRVQSHGDIAVADLVTSVGRGTEVARRVFDVIGAAALLVVSIPISLIAALAIKLTSPGPVIFAQERVGRFGRIFKVYKFRTMVADAEAHTGPVLANGRHDTRLTKIGRLLRLSRVDEVPQLWNVLRGEMSLVGPRPERPPFVRKFEQINPMYALRHQVRPGITGLAQIHGGYHTSWRDKLRFDLIYISHQSVWTDLSILFKTVWVCIVPKGHERKEEQ